MSGVDGSIRPAEPERLPPPQLAQVNPLAGAKRGFLQSNDFRIRVGVLGLVGDVHFMR